MPVNLSALTRYHTIDKCLQNRYRQWSWEDLSEKCLEALQENRELKGKGSVSKRTIEEDIRILRSDILGYAAPIAKKNGYYFYSDPKYSIRNCTLTQTDITRILSVINLLKEYRKLPYFAGLEGLLAKLEKSVRLSNQQNVKDVIFFENILPAKGAEYMEEILTAITHRQVIKFMYKPFKATAESEVELEPYALKENRNRWYVMGMSRKHDSIKRYGLDRMVELQILGKTFQENTEFNVADYFQNTIGVSFANHPPMEVKLKVNMRRLEFINTQPIHHSQKILEQNNEGGVVYLFVTLNQELEGRILSYAEEVEVLAPPELREKIISRILKVHNLYS